MKLTTFALAGILLLAASNSDSCGTESPTARENPDPETSVRPTPAPTPEYSESQPAAEYEESLPRRSERK